MEAEACRKSRQRSRVNILGAIRQQPGLERWNGASGLPWLPVRVSARLDARRLKGGLGGGPAALGRASRGS